jgi:hypothetical protein
MSKHTIATLDELLTALQGGPSAALECVHDESVSYNRGHCLPDSRGTINWTSLPTFGGAEPQSTTGVLSWDAERLLVGHAGVRDLAIVAR